jgi:hypothetical protein
MPFTKNQNGELVYVESASPINAQLENIRGVDLREYEPYIGGESEYIKGPYDQKSWNDERAESQSSISKIGNTLGQGLGTFLTATLSTAGTLAGAGAGAIGQIGDAITGQDNTDFRDTMLNNPLNQSISELDKYI